MQDLAKQQSNSYNKIKKPQTSAADEGFNPVIPSPSESIASGINDANKIKID